MLPRSKSDSMPPCRRPLNSRRPTIFFPLPTADCPLPTDHYLLPTIYYLLSTAYCLLFLLTGCWEPDSGIDTAAGDGSLAGVSLRLAVVDDPELAAVAERMRGEWHALTGSEFRVDRITGQQLATAESLPYDAVICPSHRLGPLAERGLIAPIPEGQPEKDAGDRSETFELLRLREAAWGGDLYGVAFGSPVLTCYYRPDLLEKLGRKPPESWAEYQSLAESLASLAEPPGGSAEGWCGTIEPLAPTWAGIVLLARAAPYAKHRHNYSTLFDIDTMEPLVAGPPFVRALEELVAVAKAGPADPTQYDPAAARAAFWQGKCGMTLSWPTAAAEVAAGSNVPVGFIELPGSTDVYDVGKRQWTTRDDDEDPHVPLLAVAGRIGVVGQRSEHRQSALQLLWWLSGGKFGRSASTASRATTLFSRSHLNTPQKWTEEPISPKASQQYANVTEATLMRWPWLDALRIPGRSEYLSALDEAVDQAIGGDKLPTDALQEASTRWSRITGRHGVQKQKSAYLHSLGL